MTQIVLFILCVFMISDLNDMKWLKSIRCLDNLNKIDANILNYYTTCEISSANMGF